MKVQINPKRTFKPNKNATLLKRQNKTNLCQNEGVPNTRH